MNDLLYNVQSTVARLFHALRAQKWLSHKVKVIHLATYESYREYNKCQSIFIFFLYNIRRGEDRFNNLNNIHLQFILNQLNCMELSILLKSNKFNFNTYQFILEMAVSNLITRYKISEKVKKVIYFCKILL